LIFIKPITAERGFHVSMRPKNPIDLAKVGDGSAKKTRGPARRDLQGRGEARFRTLVENSTDWMWEIDATGAYTYVSPRVRELLGYEPEELIGKRYFELMPSAEAARKVAIFEDIRKCRRTFAKLENTFISKNGKEIVLECSGVPMFGEDGTFAGYVGTNHDLTERKLSEAKVREEEAQFRGLVEQEIAGIYIIAADGTLAYVNPRFAEMFGYAASEVTGRPFLEFIGDADKDKLNNSFVERLSGVRGPGPAGFTMKRKDGVLVDVLAQSSLAILHSRPAVIGVVFDVTEHKAVEAKLRESEERYRQLFEVSRDAVMSLAPPTWKFTSANPATLEMFGATSVEEFTALGPAQVSPEFQPDGQRSSEKARAMMERGMREGSNLFEWEHRRLNGECFPAEVLLTRVEAGGQIFLYASVRDITERKQAEAALRGSQELLRRILDAIPVRVFWKDRNLTYLGCNAIFARDAGFTAPEEVIGKNDYAMGWRDQADRYRRDDREVMESGAPKLLIEEPQTTPAGETITLLTNKLPLRGSSGEIAGLLGTYMDITERKHAEEALRTSETQLSNALQIAHAGQWSYDMATGLFTFNDNFYRIFRTTAAKVGSCQMSADEYARRFCHPDDLWIVETEIKAAIETRDPNYTRQLEHRIVYADGEVGYIAVRFAIEKDKNGKTVKSYGINQDITERKHNEDLLRRLNRTLGMLNNADAVLLRATDEKKLLDSMCRVVANDGYPLVWIGFAENDAAKSVRPVACAGTELGYLEGLNISWADVDRGRGPTGTAIRTDTVQINRDFASNPSVSPWRRVSFEHGLVSSIALPLRNTATVSGSLCIYSKEADAFNSDEIKLLTDLAERLSFGIVALRNRAEREAAVDRLQRSLSATVTALASTVESRDPYTAGHQHRVSLLASAIGRELGLSEDDIQGIFFASVIHDVGKIRIPAELLSKPGKLTTLEFELIKSHAQAGYDIVKGIDFPWPVAQMILQHHERLDGSGYPNGLRGEAILRGAKILAVADVVEAMMSHRPYRPAIGLNAALAEIENGRGRLFDPAAVDACLALFRLKGYRFQVGQTGPGPAS
jgi:PAS domain S-box-containing protein